MVGNRPTSQTKLDSLPNSESGCFQMGERHWSRPPDRSEIHHLPHGAPPEPLAPVSHIKSTTWGEKQLMDLTEGDNSNLSYRLCEIFLRIFKDFQRILCCCCYIWNWADCRLIWLLSKSNCGTEEMFVKNSFLLTFALNKQLQIYSKVKQVSKYQCSFTHFLKPQAMPWELSLQCLTFQEEEGCSLQGLVNFSHWCRHSTKCIWPDEQQRAAFPLSEVSKLFYNQLNHQQRRVCSWDRMWKLPVLHSGWPADGKYHTWPSLYQLELCILWFLGKSYLRNSKDI